MEPTEAESLLRKLDRRSQEVEQILPALPTRTEVQEAIDAAVGPLATKADLTSTAARLATKEELEAAVAKLATRELEAAVAKAATKEELAAAVAKLATKEELAAAVAKLATKEELAAEVAKLVTVERFERTVATLATKAEMREEGESTRRHFDIVAERIHDEIRVIAESHLGLEEKVRRERKDVSQILKVHDKRITRLETSEARRRKPR